MCDKEKVKEVFISFLDIKPKDTKCFGIVQHPIFESIIATDGKGNMLNILEEDGFRKARIAIIDSIEGKDVNYMFMLIRNGYRLLFLKYTEPYLDEKTYAEWLKDAWISSENPNTDTNLTLSDIKEMFDRAVKKHLMDSEEYRKYTSLPDKVKCYRGIISKSNPNGFAWTTDFETAAWFADRFNMEGYILEADIPKNRIMACFDDRGEHEIVCDPRGLKKKRL